MEKLVRYRKAFYEKENDLQNGNKRKETAVGLAHKSLSSDKLYQSLSHTLPAKLPKKDKPRSNTALFCLHYAQPLLAADHSAHAPPFLRHHQIDALLRARMLDWMVEVTSSYKFGAKTYFDGVQLMDRYFEAEQESIAPGKLHIIGVQCMLIASKMEEVFPLKMKTVFEKIGHKKLPMADLVEMEERIAKSLDYRLNSWTFFDLAMLKIADFVTRDHDRRQALGELFLSQDSPQEDQLKPMQDLCSYICKFAVYDYDFICDNSAQLLAESAIKATFEILGVTTPPSFYCCSPILIELTKQKMLKAVQEHKLRFQGLGNINKFAPKEVVAQVEQHH